MSLKINIFKIITLPVVLYGCGMWSLISRGECRLKVFNRVVRRIYVSQRSEIIGGCRNIIKSRRIK
jgi:hypothetical protein